MLIQIRDLTYIYAPHTPLQRVALQGVSLEIPPGERLGVLGPTGSGKSSLAQLIAGLLRPTAGAVLLDNIAAHLASVQAAERRRRIGLAFQYPESQFFAPTVLREVAFGPRNFGLPDTVIAERVHWALQMVGLDAGQIGERSPFTLSGGEMRRVALASVLAMQPEVLILDEPFAGLDPRGRQELLQRLLAWHAETDNATLIVISHDQDHLVSLVERVIVVANGQIVLDGPTRYVLSDMERLNSLGLDVPQPVAVLHQLHAAHWAVRTDLLSPAEAAAEIARAYALRRRQG